MKMRSETIEEFLARGGKVTVVEPQKTEEDKHTIPIKTKIDHDNMSLGNGELIYSEVKARKPRKTISNEDFLKALNSAKLPQSIVNTIKEKIDK